MGIMDLDFDKSELKVENMNNICIFLCVNNACDKLDGFNCCWDSDQKAMEYCKAFRTNDDLAK